MSASSASSLQTSQPPFEPSLSSPSSPFASTLGKAFASALTHIVYELDMKVVAVQASQAELIKEMDKLATELHQFLAVSEPPPIDTVLQRLLVCRKKLLTVNLLLKSSQERLIRISALVSPT